MFNGKHPFLYINIGHKFEEVPNDAIKEVAVTALGMTILCEDTREALGRFPVLSDKQPGSCAFS